MKFNREKYLALFVKEYREEHVDLIKKGLLSLEDTPFNKEIMEEISRSIHTVKGSARVLKLNPIADLTYKLESAIAAVKKEKTRCSKELVALFVEAADRISDMVGKIGAGQEITESDEVLCHELDKVAKGEVEELEPCEQDRETGIGHGKYLDKFTEDCRAHLNEIKACLSDLEKDPDNPETLDSIFLSAHTIKGSARMLNLDPLAEVAYSIGDITDALKEKRISYSKDISDLFFKSIDVISEMFDRITVGQEITSLKDTLSGELEITVTSELKKDGDRTTTDKPEVSPTRKKTDRKKTGPGLSKYMSAFIEDCTEYVRKIGDGLLVLEKDPDDSEALNEIFRLTHTIKGTARILEVQPVAELAHATEEVIDALKEKKITCSKNLSDILFNGIDTITDMIGALASGQEIILADELCRDLLMAAKGKLIDRTGHQEPSRLKPEMIRIHTGKLDDLIKLMGEIVSGQSRFNQMLFNITSLEALSKMNMELVHLLGNYDMPDNYKNRFINSATSVYEEVKQIGCDIRKIAKLNAPLINELKDSTLKMRMLPLSTVFDKFKRLTRDFASHEKDINLIIKGEDTELDKEMIEKLGEGLVHMLKNAIDHGIESPGERVKAGKPETGVICLSASYERGNVLIELSDDGAGIPLSKIKEKAAQKNLFDRDSLDAMSSSEITDLIFLPGLSAMDTATHDSGRGIGMDVVRKNIESMKGTIHVRTIQGKETTFSIRIPLTLAIMHVMMISVSGRKFAVPVSSLNETLKVPESELIDVMMDKKAVILREQIIPVADLGIILGLPLKARKKGEDLVIIIVSVGKESYGLIIDSIIDDEHMVIKPLPLHIKNLRLVSGVVIWEDNEIVSVLNISMVIKTAKKIRALEEYFTDAEEENKPNTILVVDDSMNTREIEKDILEAYEYNVSMAEDGIEALEKARKYKYDLIITDIEMPRMDGFSLTEELRKDDEYKNTPIIIVTSREKEEDRKRGKEAGADSYIIKGDFDQTNLIDTVRNLIG